MGETRVSGAVPTACGEVSAERAVDGSLARRMVSRDVSALADVYRLHADVVYRVALATVRAPQVAEDVTQDVFLNAWRYAARFDPWRGSLRTWLLQLAHSGAVDWLRSDAASARREARYWEARVGSTGSDIEAADLAMDLGRAFERVPATQRRVIELAYFEGMTYRDVAAATGIPEGTVKSRIRVGLRHLARALTENA